jgi:hypothetical protein
MRQILRWSLLGITIIGFNLSSCTKTKSDLELATSNLSGFTNYVKIWRLTGYNINQISQTLTAAQINYTLSFNQAGTFVDNGGNTGTWQLLDSNTLSTVYINLPGGPLSQTYHIVQLSSSLLSLQYTANGNTILTSYALAN